MRTKLMMGGGALALALSLFVACGGDDGERQKTERRGTAAGSTDVEAATSGSGAGGAGVPFPQAKATATIKGVCVFDGKLPRQIKLPVQGDAFCEKCYADSGLPTSEKYEVDAATKGVPHCFVEVVGADQKFTFEVPSEPVKLDQVNCRYVPHVFGIMAGQDLVVTSSDDTQHNVHFFGKLNRLNPANFTQVKGQKDTLKFKRPERARFKCDIHGWMNCHVHVKHHPLYATSDAKGNFTLPPVPPGDYEISAWHEKFKGSKTSVTVADGETKEITLKITN